ncbi:MAG TPA: hypothetical protein VI756_31320 [Blastocatellia bacterium]
MTNPFALITRHKYLAVSSVVVVSGLAFGGWFLLRRPPRSPMEQYVPASALGFVQVDSLGQLVDGLTSTSAWRELAPLLGVSSQLRQVGQFTDLIGRLGLGPAEAVVVGRAQYAIAVTGLETETGHSGEGPYLHLMPRLVLIAKTHTTPGIARSLVLDRAQILAQRIYGQPVTPHSDQYYDTQIQVFDGPSPGHQFIAASASDLVLIGNDEPSVKLCLDVIVGRSQSMASNSTLAESRARVDNGASVFAFLTAAGAEKISGIVPALVAARFTSEPDQAAEIADLFQHVCAQAVSGVLYGAELTSDGVTDRYFTALKPSLASQLSDAMQAPAGGDFSQVNLVPPSAQGFTEISVQGIGGLPERALKNLGPQFDLVGSLALKELAIGLRKLVGLEGSDSIESAVGNQLTFVKFNDDEPEAIIISVRDRSAVTPYLDRYLGHNGSSVTRETYNGTELEISSSPDGRAAAFIKSSLVIGTRSQISGILNYQMSTPAGPSAAGLRFESANPGRPVIASSRISSQDAGQAMLAVSRITRVTDGSPEILEKDSIREALQRLPRSISLTTFEENGVYTETRSAAGNFALLASL